MLKCLCSNFLEKEELYKMKYGKKRPDQVWSESFKVNPIFLKDGVALELNDTFSAWINERKIEHFEESK